jgi:hypothetical protein
MDIRGCWSSATPSNSEGRLLPFGGQPRRRLAVIRNPLVASRAEAIWASWYARGRAGATSWFARRWPSCRTPHGELRQSRHQSGSTATSSIAAAILHPRMGKPMREAIGGGKAIIPSNVKVAAAGPAIDVPLSDRDDVVGIRPHRHHHGGRFPTRHGRARSWSSCALADGGMAAANASDKDGARPQGRIR